MPSNPVLARSPHLHGLPDFPSFTDDDFARIARQQRFLSEVKRQTKKLGNLFSLTDLRDIFVDNIDSLDRSPVPTSVNHSCAPAGYYGMKQLADIGKYRDHPNFVRATELGVLEDHYPAYRDLFASYRA